MKRLVGIVVGIIAVLGVALLIIALVLPRTEFVQKYKTQIAEELTKQLGTEVQLNGEVGVNVIPRLGLSVNDVVIKNPAPVAGDLARIGQLKANVALLPLLRKEVKTGRITIQQPYVEYIVDVNGVSNIQPILDKLQAKADQKEKPQSDSDPIEIAINGIDVRGGQVRYNDQKANTQLDFKQVDVAVGAFDFNSRSPVQVGFDVTSNLFKTDVRVQLESFFRMNLSRNQYFLDENTISLDDHRSTALVKADLIALDLNVKQLVADALTMDAKRGEFKLSAQAERIESEQDFSLFSILEINADLEDTLGVSTASIEKAHYNVTDGTLVANNAAIDAKAEGVTATLSIDDIVGDIKGSQTVDANALKGAIKYGDLPYDVNIPNVKLTLADMGVAVNQFTLTNNLSSAQGSVFLTIGEVLDARGSINAKATELKRLVTAAMGEDIDALDQLQSVNVLADWQVKGNNVVATIKEGALNDTTMTGSVSADIGAMTGDVVVNLGSVVVDDYLSQTSGSGASQPAAKGDFVLPAVPMGFTLQLNANEVTYKAQNMRVEDLNIHAIPTSQSALNLAMNGRLDLPDQKELVATTFSAAIAQTNDVISVSNIDAKASNSTLAASLAGQSLDVDMKTGDMRLKSPAIVFNSSDIKADLKAPSFLYSTNSGSMSLNDLAGTIVNGAINANVNIADLNANLNTKSLVSQSATARFSGKVKADAALHNLNLDLDQGELKVGRIQMSGDSGQLDGSINISNFTNILMANADVSLKGTELNIPLLAEQFGVTFKPSKSGSLSNASLDLVGSYHQGNIAIDKGHFAADGGVVDTTVSSKEGVRHVVLSASNINLTDWLPDPKTSTKQQSASATKAAVSPMGLFLTNRSTGTINLSNVVVSGARLDAVDAKMNVDGSNVSLNPVNVTLYGGSSTATAYYNYDSGAITFENALTQLALGDLLKDMDITSIFEGTGSMRFDGGAAGGTTPLPQRLQGEGEFAISNGQILGINFKRILVEGYSLYAQAKGKEFNYEGSTSDNTQFAELTGKVKMGDGIAKTSDIVLVAPALRVTGNGTFNLTDQTMDYTFIAYVDKAFDGQGSETDLASLDNGVPIKISGSTSKPKIGVDLQALYQQKIDEEIDRAAKKAADKMGGNAAEILDSVLGTSISKEPEPQEKPTEPSVTQNSETTSEDPETPQKPQTPTEPVDPRKQAEEALKKQAEDLLKDALKDLF